jgi:hypothetical protein
VRKRFAWVVSSSLLSSLGMRGGVSSHYFLSAANLADVSQMPGAHLYVVVRDEKKDFLFAHVFVDSVDECADDDGNFLGYVLNVDAAFSLRFIVSCDDMNAADFETEAFHGEDLGLSPMSEGLAASVDSWILSRARHLVLHYSDREFSRLVLPVEKCSSAFAASVLLQSIAAQFAVSELWGSARIDNPLACFATEYLKRHPEFVQDGGFDEVIARLAQCALLDPPCEFSALPSVSLEFEPIVPNKILTRHFMARTEERSVTDGLKKTEVAEKRHQEMLKDIAGYLISLGRQAFQTSSVDLALKSKTGLSIFELKSVSAENAFSQVEKGLFQLLYYGDALRQCGYSVSESGLVIEANLSSSAVEVFKRILNDAGVTLRVYDSSKDWPDRLSPPILNVHSAT